MSTLTELYIFEAVSEKYDASGHEVIGSKVLEGKLLPYEFTRGFLLTNDLLMVGLAFYVAITTQAPVVVRAGLELLFIGAYVLLLFARSTKQFWRAIGTYLVAIGLTVIINLVFPGAWDWSYFIYSLSPCPIVFLRAGHYHLPLSASSRLS